MVFGGLAVVSGLAAVWLMQSWAARIERARPDGGSPRAVVVAALDLTRGTALTPDDLTTRTLPSAFAPPGSVTDVDALVGRTLAADVPSGEAVTPARLAGTAVGPVAALVPADRRAYLMASGLPPAAVRPGDRVDVLATFGGGRSHVETVAEGLEIARTLAGKAALPSVATTGSSGGDTLVLLVDTDTAQRLAFAAAFAKLTVIVAPPLTASASSLPSPNSRP
jgi:pilus assembly protein CpaB